MTYMAPPALRSNIIYLGTYFSLDESGRIDTAKGTGTTMMESLTAATYM